MPRNSIAAVGVAALVVLATVGVVGLGTGSAQSTADSPADRTISVAATGSAEASPDQALVHVTVNAEGNDSAEVRSSLASQAEDLRAALDELGVEYETVRYSIDQQRDHRREEPTSESDRPEYRGVHSFQVTLDDTNRTGSVVDAAADAGAEVDGIRLTLSDERRDELRTQAIEDAMADARIQATTIADAANLTVTGVASVDASQSRYGPVAYETAAGGDSGGPPTEIDSGAVTVTYAVQVTYNAST